MASYVCGIDIGISGTKVLILRKDGFVVARSLSNLPAPISNERKSVQNPFLWWQCVKDALSQALTLLVQAGGSPKDVSAICIDATSGTIVPVDENLNPLDDAIMYNDSRATEETRELNFLAIEDIKHLGYRFDTRFALPKILYMKKNNQNVWDRTRYILHQADFIVTRLMGENALAITDTSNALKTGYDILNFRWPKYLDDLDIKEKMPTVVKTGSIIGQISKEVCEEFNLSKDIKIIAGMTDSVAACTASGVKKDGDMNTILGSTLTWKVLSKNIVKDEYGRIYSHLHPSGSYLPGGMGNSGGFGIRRMMDASPKELTEYAFKLNTTLPSSFFAYPLPEIGEKYPFIDPWFKPFVTKSEGKGACLYKALIESVACIERWGYETLESLQADIHGDVWTTGGGAMVDSWMKIRANVLNRVVLRTRFPESVYGAALTAAMGVWFNGDFAKTADSYIIEMARFEPNNECVKRYDEYYHAFRQKVLSNKS